ncbi:MAG: HD domain-containing protein [Lachnospiraceae bacterium]|nr:HD domain-containing protein [Lachnospiraceae bacterium]
MRHLIKISRITLPLLAMLFFLSTVCEAATPGVSVMGQEGRDYSSVLYNNSNGLPTSEANAIVQSQDGFIWVGSYSGLIRYDGNDFYRFDSSVGIASVVSLYVDSKDRLWIGTNDSGIVLHEEGEFSFFGKSEGLPSLSVRSIAEDGEGNIIFATTQGMVYIDTQGGLHVIDDARINTEYICEIRRADDGTVYGCTLKGDFFYLKGLKVAAFYNGQELGMGVISCICPVPDEAGFVYLGTEESTVIYGDMRDGMENYQTLSVSPQSNINAIYPESSERLWICADNGIGYFDENGRYSELQDVPMDNSVDEMMVDYEGNRWFVSSRQGVMKLVGNRFTDISRIAGLKNEVVNSTCIYQGDLYIGTDSGLRLLDENYQQKENVMTELLEGIRIRCIKEDSAGNLWLCSYSELGLICYHGDGTYEIYNKESGLKSDRVRTVSELSDGTIAAATNGGVHLIKDGKVTDTYDEADGIINTEILTICEDDDGRIYLGSDGNGIYVVDGKEVYNLGMEDGLRSEIILRMKKDPERSLYWIITSNSISYMKDGQIYTLSNFPYSNNFDLYFDNNGGIWVLSSSGIYVVSGEQMLQDEEPEYLFYDMSCGLPCVATANSWSHLSEDGELYISGSRGVSCINIYEKQTGDEAVKLSIPFVEADGQMIALRDGETVQIPSDCRRLTIHAYALTYSLQNPRLSYYLEGFDTETASASRREMQPVSYTNLSGGKYIFHFSVIDTMTGKEVNTISVTFIKEKRLHERGIFWVLLFMSVMVLVSVFAVVYTRHKTGKLIVKQKENKIFKNQMIQAFATCIDLKDKYTKGHSFRVAKYAAKLAEKLGYDKDKVSEIYDIALLHDIGKITIPDDILNKPQELTDEEYAIMKQHAKNGYDILKKIEISPDLSLGAGYHHERIDGHGYPFGKKGEEIPKIAQIIAVADTFDTMNSTRPYRERLKKDAILAELRRIAGTQLNAEVVQLMIGMIEGGELAEAVKE